MKNVGLMQMLLFLVLFSACTPPRPDLPHPVLPSPTVPPSVSSSPQLTRFPPPTWQKITPENAAEIMELARPNLGEASHSFWTSDGSLLLVIGEAGVSVYDGITYTLINFLDASNEVTGSALSPDGNLLVLATSRDNLEFWDLETLERTDLLPIDPLHWCSGSQGRVSFNSSGKLLAIEMLYGREYCTLVWDSELRGVLHAIPGHIRPLFSPTEPNLLATYFDNNIYMRGAYDGEVLYYLPGSIDYQFSPDGDLFVTRETSEEQRDRFALWEVEGGVLRHTFPDRNEYFPSVYFVDWQGRTALAGFDTDGVLILWDLNTGTLQKIPEQDISGENNFTLHTHQNTFTSQAPAALHLWLTGMRSSGNEVVLSDHGGWVTTFAFHPDQSKLFIAYDNQPAEIYNLISGMLEAQIEKHIKLTSSFAFSPDGGVLLTEHDDFVLLRDPFSGTTLQRFNSGFLFDPRVSYLDATNQVLIFGEEKNENLWEARLTFWDPGSGEMQDTRVLEGKPDLHGRRNFWISPDERFLVSSQTGGVWIWEISSGQRVALLQHMYGKFLTFAPNGEHLLGLLGDGTLAIWDTGNWQQISQLNVPEDAFLITMNPEGNLLAVATSLADNVVVRDMENSEWIGTCQPEVHNIIREIAFDPDGRLLAIAHDNHIALCDLATQEIIYETPGQADWIPQVAFHPTGRFFLSISWGGTTSYWGVP